MKEVVFEVIIGILILSLLVVVINLFRGNVDIIGSTATKVEEAEKIKADLAFNKDKKEVNGSDVIAVIRYYKNDSSVKIYVDGELYQGSEGVEQPVIKEVSHYDAYDADYEFDTSGKLQRITYTKKLKAS